MSVPYRTEVKQRVNGDWPQLLPSPSCCAGRDRAPGDRALGDRAPGCWAPGCWALGCWAMIGLAILGSLAAGQEPSPAPTSPLVEGLLDLLEEPKAASSGRPNDRTNPPGQEQERDGRQQGQAVDNPLAAVGQRMLLAADYMNQGLDNARTQQLQAGIVQQLDELISELERAEQQNSKRQQQQQQQQQQPTQSPTQASTASGASSAGKQPGDDTPHPASSEAGAQDGPGPTGTAASKPTVELVDPRRLQQSVWGQLPEQVRKQMQSRMVERFLPSYRQQIESYFQALLENP